MFILAMIRTQPKSTLFPYTTLFRSQRVLKNKGRKLLEYKKDNGDFPLRRFVWTPTLDEKLTGRSEEHTSELQSQSNLVCRLLLEKKKETLAFQPSSHRNIRPTSSK